MKIAELDPAQVLTELQSPIQWTPAFSETWRGLEEVSPLATEASQDPW